MSWTSQRTASGWWPAARGGRLRANLQRRTRTPSGGSSVHKRRSDVTPLLSHMRLECVEMSPGCTANVWARKSRAESQTKTLFCVYLIRKPLGSKILYKLQRYET